MEEQSLMQHWQSKCCLCKNQDHRTNHYTTLPKSGTKTYQNPCALHKAGRKMAQGSSDARGRNKGCSLQSVNRVNAFNGPQEEKDTWKGTSAERCHAASMKQKEHHSHQRLQPKPPPVALQNKPTQQFTTNDPQHGTHYLQRDSLSLGNIRDAQKKKG